MDTKFSSVLNSLTNLRVRFQPPPPSYFNSKLPFWLYFVNTADKRFFSWMIACLCQAMSLDQDEETIYADFNADAYNDLIEYQFSNIVKLMSGLVMGDSVQEKVLKELSTNLASLMVVEN